MVEVILTANTSLNGGEIFVRVKEYDDGGKINQGGIYIEDGWGSYTLGEFQGQTSSNKYEITTILFHATETKSPILNYISIESPNTIANVKILSDGVWKNRPIYTYDGEGWSGATSVKTNDGDTWN